MEGNRALRNRAPQLSLPVWPGEHQRTLHGCVACTLDRVPRAESSRSVPRRACGSGPPPSGQACAVGSDGCRSAVDNRGGGQACRSTGDGQQRNSGSASTVSQVERAIDCGQHRSELWRCIGRADDRRSCHCRSCDPQSLSRPRSGRIVPGATSADCFDRGCVTGRPVS